MGILDGVMKKQPTEEELQAREDLMMKSSEEKYEEEARRQNEEDSASKNRSQGTDRTVIQLERDVELLKVQIELMKQNKQVTDERFEKFSEQIGEMRATVLDSERDGATIKVQAEKAIGLIQMVQPEKLMAEVKKLEARIEAAKGMEEKFSAMQQKIVDEIKDLRARTEVIRGSETMLKLNEEVKAELSTALQVQSKMEIRADKIEAIYAEFQQHFYEYQKVFDRMKDLDSEFKDIMKDFNVFKVKVDGSASKSDFLKLKNELKEYGESLDSKIIEVDKAVAKSGMLREDVMKDVASEISEAKTEILGKITSAEQAAERISAMRTELQKSIMAESLKFKKDFEQRISLLEKQPALMEALEDRVGEAEKTSIQVSLIKTDVEKARKETAAMAKSFLALQSSFTEIEKAPKAIKDLEKQAGDLQEANIALEKRLKASELQAEGSAKKLEGFDDTSKLLGKSADDADKRLKSLETKTSEYLQKSERKLDSAVSDVADNTAVVRDLIKEVYSLKTHSSNAISKTDLSNLQKSVNEKLIVFDMSLIKLEHHIADYEKGLRDQQRDFEQKLKELRRDVGEKVDELETTRGNFGSKKFGNRDIV
ncbi:MAG: hypothetical protein ABH863_00685 [Candidatus Micrarchaeota archaeon]